MILSDAELDLYARHIVLPQLGGAGQLALKRAKVAIVGAGGIGSAVIPALGLAGVGNLTVIDPDRVERSNLQRQPIYKSSQLGMGKALLAAQFVQERNPFVEVRDIGEAVDRDNADALLAGNDLIVDGTDNFATRLAVSDAAARLDIPLLSAAAQQFQGQVGLFRGRPCYRCFVGDAFDTDDCDTCAEEGVLGAMTATVGAFAALMAIRTLARLGEDIAGKLHLFDGLGLEWRVIRLPADPGCRACGANQPRSG